MLQFFSLGGLRASGAPSETSPPCPSVCADYARSSTLGDCLLPLSEFDKLRRALLYCMPSDRSFAYMWGVGLRAHLKFSNQRGKIRTQRARPQRCTHAAAAPCEQTEALSAAQSACLDERAQQRHANCSSRRFQHMMCRCTPRCCSS